MQKLKLKANVPFLFALVEALWVLCLSTFIISSFTSHSGGSVENILVIGAVICRPNLRNARFHA